MHFVMSLASGEGEFNGSGNGQEENEEEGGREHG